MNSGGRGVIKKKKKKKPQQKKKKKKNQNKKKKKKKKKNKQKTTKISHTTRQSKHMQGKATKTRFLKIGSQIWVVEPSEISAQTLFFEVKLLFQSLPETFLHILRPCSRYLEGPPNFVCFIGKVFLKN